MFSYFRIIKIFYASRPGMWFLLVALADSGFSVRCCDDVGLELPSSILTLPNPLCGLISLLVRCTGLAILLFGWRKRPAAPRLHQTSGMFDNCVVCGPVFLSHDRRLWRTFLKSRG